MPTDHVNKFTYEYLRANAAHFDHLLSSEQDLQDALTFLSESVDPDNPSIDRFTADQLVAFLVLENALLSFALDYPDLFANYPEVDDIVMLLEILRKLSEIRNRLGN